MWDRNTFTFLHAIAVGVGVGVAGGVAATASPTFGALSRPVVALPAPLAKIAPYPALILILGFEHASKIALARTRALPNVALPSALPSVLTGCRIGLVISCIVVFLAEMITSTNGLGHLLIYAARNCETVDMFVPLITISLLGLLLNTGFNALQCRLLLGFPDEL